MDLPTLNMQQALGGVFIYLFNYLFGMWKIYMEFELC